MKIFVIVLGKKTGFPDQESMDHRRPLGCPTIPYQPFQVWLLEQNSMKKSKPLIERKLLLCFRAKCVRQVWKKRKKMKMLKLFGTRPLQKWKNWTLENINSERWEFLSNFMRWNFWKFLKKIRHCFRIIWDCQHGLFSQKKNENQTHFSKTISLTMLAIWRNWFYIRPELGLGSEVHFSPGLDSRVGTSYQSRPRTDPEPVPVHNRPGRVRTTGYKGLD